jgi:prevent-host-death family protein
MGKVWPLQDAKARFSEVVRAATREPQYITVRGEETAVLISADEYRRLKRAPVKSLAEVLQGCPYELEIPARSRESGRDIEL